MTRLIPLLLSASLLLTGSGLVRDPAPEPTPSHSEVLTQAIRREAAIPEFPKQPAMPSEEDMTWEDMQHWYDDMAAYQEAVNSFRPGAPDESLRQTLSSFAAASTPKALSSATGQNAIYSPVSLWTALAMLAQCAEDTSRAQALDVLGVPDIDSLAEDVSRLWRQLYTDDGSSALLLGNSIWLNNFFQDDFRPETLDVLAQKYFTDTCAADFGSASADQAVSEWTASRTGGLIGGDGPIVKTDPGAMALLVSSLYYKAAWTTAFEQSQTKEDLFTATDGTKQIVDFLHRTATGATFRQEKAWRSSSLPLDLGNMIFVLPEEGTTPEQLLKDPTFLSSLLDQDSGNERHGKVEWSVPKFDLSSQLDLNEALKSLGLTDLLDPNRSNLSALVTRSAFVSQVSQLGRVKLDEDGVEAAAVTMVTMEPTSAPPSMVETFEMNLNRPFLFVLEMEGLPLFVGLVQTIDA